MYYKITHRTRYKYSASVSESVTEVRKQPRSDGNQRLLAKFKLSVAPNARIFEYPDANGNVVHYFDHPTRHAQLLIHAEAQVEVLPPSPLPVHVSSSAWAELDAMPRTVEMLEMLATGTLSQPSALLRAFARELGVETRRDDPLTVLRYINSAVYKHFDYVPHSTAVDSHIDDALTDRRGVCQDFTHIMIALGRELGIPCRYVSGYLYHVRNNGGRSSPDASHAWMEALLPGLGWVGFDPTNDLLADERHIRVAVGREYGDVPPTRGVFKGSAESQLMVEVNVQMMDAPPQVDDQYTPDNAGWVEARLPLISAADAAAVAEAQAQMAAQQ
jgi:transglutaminase-like putative cysteine protease